MAVTRAPNVIHMTAASDSVSDKLYVLGFSSTGALTVENGGGVVIWDPGSEQQIAYGPDCGIPIEGITLSAATGELFVYYK